MTDQQPLPRIVLDPWSERTSLSAYDGGGRRMSPERAYAGMPADAKLAAAICDSAISNQWGWLSSVLLVILGENKPATLSVAQIFFKERGWRDVEDAYDAANVTKNQRTAFNLHMAHFTAREIATLMDVKGKNPAHTVRVQILRTIDKLKRVMIDEDKSDVDSDGHQHESPSS